MTKVTIQNLMEAGVHYGHQTKRWNPKMKQYVYGVRNGIYIVDLTKSMVQLESACKFVFETVLNGGEILLVGTKRQAQETIRESAEGTGMHYVCERWLGGTLTNSKTIRKSISKMEGILAMQASGELDARPKKEASSLRRKLHKLQRDLSGIVEMRKMPQAMVVIDVKYEDIAVKEAARLDIPVVALVDTNCNPDNIAHVIPGNDDAHRAIKIIVDVISNTIKAAQEYKSSLEEKEAEIEAAAAAAEAAKAAEEAAATDGGTEETAASDTETVEETADKDSPIVEVKKMDANESPEPEVTAVDAPEEATETKDKAPSDGTKDEAEKEVEEK